MTKDILEEVFEFSKKIQKGKKNFKDLIPYHLNIIDEIHANENANSKILGKILNYSVNNEFPFLASFYNDLEFEISPIKPVITIEKERIDILICDNDYAVIVENKIHYAEDQENQVNKYVERVMEKGYGIENIFVLYLTRWGNKIPTKDSVPDELRKKLGSRYKEINFKQNILPWLEDALLNCKIKEIVFIAAIKQYIDYLQGMFFLRDGFNKINNKMNELLKKELNISENFNKKDFIEVESKFKQVQECNELLQNLRIEMRNKLRADFLEKLFDKIKKNENWTPVVSVYKKVEFKKNKIHHKEFGFKNEGLVLKINGINLFLSIEIQDWKKFICGVFINGNEEIKKALVEKFNEHKLGDIKIENYWIYLNPKTYEFKGSKIGYNIYDDKWNNNFVDDMESIVSMFHEKINKMLKIWKKICIK